MTRADFKALLGLDLPDRMALVQTLWESIRQSEDTVALTDGERRYIDERVAAYERHPDLRDWQDLRAEFWPQLG